jgi:hypothetical protein
VARIISFEHVADHDLRLRSEDCGSKLQYPIGDRIYALCQDEGIDLAVLERAKERSLAGSGAKEQALGAGHPAFACRTAAICHNQNGRLVHLQPAVNTQFVSGVPYDEEWSHI